MRKALILGILSILMAWGCSNEKQSIATPEKEESKAETNQNLAQYPPGEKVLIKTSKGNITILLYNETPLHQSNFLKLVNEGFYDSLLFHRVIKGFMIQGGDPKSKNADISTPLGSGGPGYTIPAEFNQKFIHKKGALAAARRGGPGNPAKESSGSQYYIVQGKVITDSELDQKQLSLQRVRPEFRYSPEQREIYKTIGGTPQLDMDYTVYGEVIEGLEVIDSIADVTTAKGNRPIEDVVMFMQVIK